MPNRNHRQQPQDRPCFGSNRRETLQEVLREDLDQFFWQMIGHNLAFSSAEVPKVVSRRSLQRADVHQHKRAQLGETRCIPSLESGTGDIHIRLEGCKRGPRL